MGRVLRVFDFDDTLAKSTAYIYVTHKDGTETTLDPGQYAKYKPQRGDEFDFRDFNSMLNNPKVIRKNFKLLQKMLSNPEKKVTILTARALGFPIRKFFKDTYGMDVYPVTLASNNPKDKADWIKDKIENDGYNDIYYADDSIKNIKAAEQMLSKTNVRWKVQHVKY